MYLAAPEDVEAASRAHGRRFDASPPANTTFLVGDLVGHYKVEIEAEAVLSQ
jgi:enamine deaminase RidA (YjgF/YER057c/UK114 family)